MCLGPSAWQHCQARELVRNAQVAIDDSLSWAKEQVNVCDLAAEPETRDLAPKVTTSISFNHCVNLAFFQTLIQVPAPSIKGQPRWHAAIIMDIQSPKIPKARIMKSVGTVGFVYKEYLAAAYHPETQLVAYSVGLEFTERSGTGAQYWFLSSLYLCNLKQQVNWDNDTPPKVNNPISQQYSLSK